MFNRPFLAYCEYCNREITTYAKKEYNFYVILLVIFCFYFYGFLYGLILIIVTFPLFQTLFHICPTCYTTLYKKEFFPIKKKENFLTLQYGSSVIVIKFFYILILLALVGLFGVYINVQYWRNKPKSISHEEKIKQTNKFISNLYDKNSNLTWEELIKDCGSKVMIENSARGIEIFNRKYFKKTIDWKGYFLNAFFKRLSPFDYDTSHLVNLNIRMIPSETIKSQDLVLSLDYKKYFLFYKTLEKLETGTPIRFTATFESLGDEWRDHHLHLKTIEIIDDFIKEDEKVVLFKGVKFDIVGHLKIRREVQKIQGVLEQKNSSEINPKEIQDDNFDPNLNLTLEDESNEQDVANKEINSSSSTNST